MDCRRQRGGRKAAAPGIATPTSTSAAITTKSCIDGRGERRRRDDERVSEHGVHATPRLQRRPSRLQEPSKHFERLLGRGKFALFAPRHEGAHVVWVREERFGTRSPRDLALCVLEREHEIDLTGTAASVPTERAAVVDGNRACDDHGGRRRALRAAAVAHRQSGRARRTGGRRGARLCRLSSLARAGEAALKKFLEAKGIHKTILAVTPTVSPGTPTVSSGTPGLPRRRAAAPVRARPRRWPRLGLLATPQSHPSGAAESKALGPRLLNLGLRLGSGVASSDFGLLAPSG